MQQSKWPGRQRARNCVRMALMSVLLLSCVSCRAGTRPHGQFGSAPDVRPDLNALSSLALTRALSSPDNLWKFLTAPETGNEERMAAALQGKKVFPVSWLWRLMRAREALREEQSLHHWGLEPSPHSAEGVRPWTALPARDRRRLILGHIWIVPETPTGFEPDYWKPAGAEPWPWQVQAALDTLFTAIAPSMHVKNPPADVAYAETWYAEALKMPCSTDTEAALFVEATTYPQHYKSLPVLARWYRIALNPHFPRAALSVASEIGEAMYLWGDPQAQAIGQVMIADILHRSREPEVRLQAAWSTIHLRERFTEAGAVQLPPPQYVLVTLGDMALDESNGSEWDRLYTFVRPACKLLPDPPIQADIDHMRPDSPEVHTALETFRTWFRQHRAAYLRAGQAQLQAAPAIAAVRGIP